MCKELRAEFLLEEEGKKPVFYKSYKDGSFEKHEGWFGEASGYDYVECSEEEYKIAWEKFTSPTYQRFAIVQDQSENAHPQDKWFFTTLEEAYEMEERYSMYAIRYRGTYEEIKKVADESEVYINVEFY